MKTLLSDSILSIGLSAGHEAFAGEWGYCRDGVAFEDEAATRRKPDYDWVCSLPEDDKVEPRCPRAQERHCAHTRGNGVNGPHNVPSGAWFAAVSENSKLDVKCLCGCFAPGTMILTSAGAFKIENLYEFSKRVEVFPLVRQSADDTAHLAEGTPLRSQNFTRGPEEKPLVRILTSHGKDLKLTSNHPVLVIRHEGQAFIKADELVVGDVLLDSTGAEVKVERLVSSREIICTSKVLPRDDALSF